MQGAIIGDVIGSRFEKDNLKSKDFELFVKDCRFTDDTVLTVAIADAILKGQPYEEAVKNYGLFYSDAGYGSTFKKWLAGKISGPYNSWGNGSAMRVSPVAYAFDDLDTVLSEAEKSAAITHNHPEGIKGAQAVAGAIFLARKEASKEVIKEFVEDRFRYDLNRILDAIRPVYTFDVSCQGSVPEAIISFLESASFEESIRNAISLGGDSDTIACMAGAIAEPFFGDLPTIMVEEARTFLPQQFLDVIDAFTARYLT